ncbi:MAG: hypothetical protein QGG87_05870, partial [Nitrospinota bacterium]|nr:hypothetical protein [Nitrospinota bacterium]
TCQEELITKIEQVKKIEAPRSRALYAMKNDKNALAKHFQIYQIRVTREQIISCCIGAGL